MKILLLSMPDTVPLFYCYKSSVANLGLRSIAGNLNLKGVESKILDLVFFPKKTKSILKKAISEYKPDLVGISSMSFQYESARGAAGFIRDADPRIKVALGGYHATLMYEEIAAGNDAHLFDFIIRGEGELAFRQLAEKMIGGESDFSGIDGLSHKRGGTFTHNKPSGLIVLDTLRMPVRDADLFKLDVGPFGMAETIESSRGCRMGCNFCSIRKMYGRSYRAYKVERVIEDIKRARSAGANRIIFADDNITQDTENFGNLCDNIYSEGLDDIYYGIQTSVEGIASSEQLVAKMRRANICLVFLGIEAITAKNLKQLKKGDIVRSTDKAIGFLRKHDIGIKGGFIVGNPDDKKEDIRNIFKFATNAGIDSIMCQILTPYPKTEIREELNSLNLIENPLDFSRYNGFEANVRTKHLTAEEVKSITSKECAKWYLSQVFNASNWFAKSKRVLKLVYIRLLAMTVVMAFSYWRGRYGYSYHRKL
jgi:radical SAM superfamily enzyme YgiQ (UPF0313 family)